METLTHPVIIACLILPLASAIVGAAIGKLFGNQK